MNKMMMCFSSISNIDPLDMLSMSKDQFGCDNIAIRIHDGTKDVALLNGKDEFLPKLLAHAKDRHIDIYFYADIKGSDPALEVRAAINRISKYLFEPALKGHIVRVTDAYSIRTANSIKVYFDALGVFPTLDVGIFDTTTKKLNLMPEFLKRVNFSCILVAGGNVNPWDDCIRQYMNYMTWYGMNSSSTYKFIPMLGIYDMPDRKYRFTRGGAVSFHTSLMADPDIMGGTYWNYTPDNNEAPLVAHNTLIQGLPWTKEIVDTPIPEPPEDNIPTRDEIIKVLSYLLSKEKL
jgi:hypothetical protein